MKRQHPYGVYCRRVSGRQDVGEAKEGCFYRHNKYGKKRSSATFVVMARLDVALAKSTKARGSELR